jgi:photosystem II stability/assembly factor-like uncharacterized protein
LSVLSVLLLIITIPLAFWQPPFPRPAEPFGERTFLQWVWYPIEKNAALRLPSAPAAIIGLAVIDAQHGWAVGNGGTILATTDGGINWTAQASGTDADLFAVQFLADGLHGWAVGTDGTILTTADGGGSWTTETSGTNADLSAVQLLADGQHGWAVGDGGTILETTDGGANWTAQKSGTNADLLGIQFLPDGQKGWVVGNSGIILATNNAGGSWTFQTSGQTSFLTAVEFLPDGQRGWAVGGLGTILTTGDSGGIWAAQKSGTRQNLSSVQFLADGQHGWAVGEGGTILATTDGGGHWNPEITGTQANFLSIAFLADGQHGWATGSHGTILTTNDGGRIWNARTRGGADILNSAQFLDDGKHGWAAGDDGTILATTDGGESWTTQRSGTHADLSAVQFLPDGQHGWMVGIDGTILVTSNGGGKWTAHNSGTLANLDSIHFLEDGQRGWAVGTYGTILATNDGGGIWTSPNSGTHVPLISVQVLADGQRGWAVGGYGTILETTDGGRSWTAQRSGTEAVLLSVKFLADGQRGWAVGSDGTILATTDGGGHWSPETSGTKSSLFGVLFNSDGQSGWVAGEAGTVLVTQNGGKTWSESDSHVGTVRLDLVAGRSGSKDQSGAKIWAVGYPPALLVSTDGGKSWTPETLPIRYSRYPAPWFWLTTLCAGLLWTRSIEFQRKARVDGAEAAGFTDAPTVDFAQDRLGYGALAKGISRFLRNPATVPPLTLAITGDWGSGKSSLMALICADLRRYGSHPVWFNAWHYQQSDQLLAGLLSAVRDQALPSWLTLDGLAFRLRLLWLRSKNNFVVTLILILLLSASVTFIMSHDAAAWYRLLQIVKAHLPWDKAAPKTDATTLSTLDLSKLLGQSASGIATLVAVGKALTAFGANPAVLLSTAAEKFRLKDASALNNFRTRFAQQFHDVTEALPHRMTIVIDDLDRCRPEAILEVMEAVNFLVSSGSCFIIFGMATERVQAALALSFEKIAVEMAELTSSSEEQADPTKKEEIDRQRRRRYARDYLEKLVNLEILVPSFAERDASRLFDRQDADEGNPWTSAWRPVARLWPVLLIALAIVGGMGFGWRLPALNPPPPATVVQPATAVAPTKSVAAAAPAVRLPPTPQAVQRYVPAVQPGDAQNIEWYVFAAPLALLILCLAGFTIYQLRSAVRQVQDTQGFREAMRAWTPFVRSSRPTPRAIKRFGNRIRYLAMLHQPETLDESGYDALRNLCATAFARIGKWMAHIRLPVTPARPPQPDEDVSLDMAEEHIVALGALNECFGPHWRDCARGVYSCDEQRERIHAVLEALRRQGRRFSWPPTDEELDRFETSLRGVRTPSI